MPRHNWLWSAKNFEDLEEPNVKAKRSSGYWRVAVGGGDVAWGYCVKLDEEAQAHIMWHSRIEVKGAAGDVWPGLAFHDSRNGALLMANSLRGVAELRLLKVNSEVLRTEIFKLPRLECPYSIILEYNAITANCIGRVGGAQVFEFTLPHGNIPSISDVSAIEIVTTTSPNEEKSVVNYGDLALDCE
jgi:hypothetical protein